MVQETEKKQTFRYNSAKTYTTYSSTFVKDKQLSFADNIHYKQLVSRHGDNYTDAFQFHLVHAVSGTLQSF